ncbi:nicotinic acid mononucleotide adenylyltransferase [Actinobaculum suis]|uniref:Probable nicotinate-nucleotide adenylyltransferase n=1 Tax=Actinobaculum suis TaxID=1657 RepID=A0A7Z8Y9Q7_9ACTO|nr:nicotinate-nucleotide adenylyltransferase [Actinobaculum suis]VDG76296.1 nicotinic acid mononucleotide adenylyltransferase [Actinobaculum suis]
MSDKEENIQIPFDAVRTGRRRRIGIMGGTFDPIHHGHLVAASEVQYRYNLDEVVFVPTGNPAFKQDRHVTLAEHRYLMAVIATSSNTRFTVSRADIERGGITYTVDTLRDLHQIYPDAELFFITGADILPEILRWKEPEELWNLAKFIGVTRPGHKISEEVLRDKHFEVVEVPAMAISSTDVRERVARDAPIWYLVPDAVVQHIRKYHLYRRGESPTQAPASVDN